MTTTSNDAAFAALQAQIRRLERLPVAITEAAPEVADALHVELDAQIAAGTDPDGTPWQPTLAGKRPLQNASASLTVRAIGNVILAKLTGPTALHHMGQARGGVRRQVLPSSKMPSRITNAIRTVCERILRRAVVGE